MGIGIGINLALRRLGAATVAYLFRDDFLTPHGIGAINQPANPGPGTLKGIDTGGKQSISGGKLIVTGGKVSPTTGDPSVWGDSRTRVAGLLMGAKVNVTTFNTIGPVIGWAATPAAEPINHSVQFRGTVFLRVYDSNASVILVGNQLSTAVDYTVIVGQRYPVGAHYYIKGGIYQYFTRIWVSDRDATATLVPVIVNFDNAYTASFLRDPDAIWDPPPLASDSFNRANGALGTSDGAGHQEANGGGGLIWTPQVGTWAIASNVATATALSGGKAIATVPIASPDAIHDADGTWVSGEAGTIVRYTDANNQVRGIIDGTNVKLIKRVAGVETTVTTGVAAPVVGKLPRIICFGNQFELYYNFQRIGTRATINDAALQSSAVVGLYTSDITNSMDNMRTWSVGTANENAQLELFF